MPFVMGYVYSHYYTSQVGLSLAYVSEFKPTKIFIDGGLIFCGGG